MADEFGQFIKGLHVVGDTIVSTDSHPAMLAKKGTAYDYLSIDATSGGLQVDVVDIGTVTVTATDLDIRDLSASQDNVAISDGTDTLAINTDGSINIGDISAGTQTNDVKITLDGESVTVTATDLDIRDLTSASDSVEVLQATAGNLNATVVATDFDIRDLSHTQDSVKIGDGTDFLAINSDGSINVSMSGAGADNQFEYGSANLVKDTLTLVATIDTPAQATNAKSILVSGAGLCEWEIKFGTDGSEAVIASFWTTPSSPTYHYDLPDSLNIQTTETLIVSATNREKAGTPSSDFTGHATIVYI